MYIARGFPTGSCHASCHFLSFSAIWHLKVYRDACAPVYDLVAVYGVSCRVTPLPESYKI